jgi:putative transposase
MFLKGYKHRDISVSSGFISKLTGQYEELRVTGLRLRYLGSVGYLEPEQRQSVLAWLKGKHYWHLSELQAYIEEQYGVVFDSKQSDYTLFEQAGIRWKKTQRRNPRVNPILVEKKQELIA